MNINEVYYKVKNHSYNDEDLNWLLSDNKIIFSLNSFPIYCEIVKELRKNNELDFMNKFIAICREKRNNSRALVFRLLFDQEFINDTNINYLINYIRIDSVHPIVANIGLNEIKKYVDKNTFIGLTSKYYGNLSSLYLDEEIPVDEIITNMNLEYLYIHDDSDSFLELIRFFGENELFNKKMLDFFSKYPDKIMKVTDYNILDILKSYEYMNNNIKCNGVILSDIKKFDVVLKKYCDYENGCDFSQTAMIKLYDYYHNANRLEEIKNLLSHWYGNSINDKKLFLRDGYEQFIYHVMKIDNQMKLYIDFHDVDNHYDELCQLEPKNIFIDFGGIDNDGIMTFLQYKKAKKFYDNISEKIKKYNLSPLETYLYVCNMAYSFKTYRFYRDDEKLDKKYSQLSRNPFYIVDNEYIVCAGYVNFALELLKRLDIPASFLVISSKELYNTKDSNETHAQVLVHLEDPKYNVDGVYIGEVTAGNVKTPFTYSNAVLTRDRDKYNKYQIGENTRSWFLEAMDKLDIPNNYKDDKKDEFYDILNRPIQPWVLCEALMNTKRKTEPHLSDEEIYNEFRDIFDYLPHTDKMLKKQLKDMRYNQRCIAHDINFNYFLNPEINKNVSFVRTGSASWGTHIRFDIMVKVKDKNNKEVNDILSSNKAIFENEFINFYYFQNQRCPGIQVTVPTKFTGEDLKMIFLRAAYSINELLGNGILQNWYEHYGNQNVSRKR